MKRINTYQEYFWENWSAWGGKISSHYGFETFRIFPGSTMAGANRMRNLLEGHHEKTKE